MALEILNFIHKERERGKERIEGGEDMNPFEEALLPTMLEDVAPELHERITKSKNGREFKAGCVVSYFLEKAKDEEKKQYIKNMLKENVSLDKIVNECINYKSQREIVRQKRKRIIKYSIIATLISGFLIGSYFFKKKYDIKIEKQPEVIYEYIDTASPNRNF